MNSVTPFNRSHRLDTVQFGYRRGFSLLELMIALGLLGALMSVAWSLMATFGAAEQRGWKITRRTQIIRAAHSWLQSDAKQMRGMDTGAKFVGNSLGFKATIATSLDPLPFLERLMSDASSAEEPRATSTNELPNPGLGEGNSSFNSRNSDILPTDSPWAQETVHIEYELLASDEVSQRNAPDATQSVLSPTPDEMQFTLIRRELIDVGSPIDQEARSSDSGNASASFGSPAGGPQLPSASDRILTGQDLYRQTDEVSAAPGFPLSHKRLEGLVRPQFQYSDGRSWSDSWNSRTTGRLPSAIALRFDFPARSEMKTPQPRRSETERMRDSDTLPTMSAADVALASTPQAELETDVEASLMESAQYEVQLVVAVAGAFVQLHESPLDGSQPNDSSNLTSGTGALGQTPSTAAGLGGTR